MILQICLSRQFHQIYRQCGTSGCLAWGHVKCESLGLPFQQLEQDFAQHTCNSTLNEEMILTDCIDWLELKLSPSIGLLCLSVPCQAILVCSKIQNIEAYKITGDLNPVAIYVCVKICQKVTDPSVVYFRNSENLEASDWSCFVARRKTPISNLQA